jgi:hypothetical protein
MDFRIDLDPTHRVIRLTIKAAVVTLQLAESCYFQLSKATSDAEDDDGGPYAAIYDLCAVTGTTIDLNLIKGFASRAPSIPMGRPHVVVAKDPAIYELARIFQVSREYRQGYHFEVVRTLGEAYKLVEARSKDFTVCLFPRDVTA